MPPLSNDDIKEIKDKLPKMQKQLDTLQNDILYIVDKINRYESERTGKRELNQG